MASIRGLSPRTRLRAWFLRTFRGRRPDPAAAPDPPPPAAGPPRRFELPPLALEVVPVGLRAAGANAESLVYRVALSVVPPPAASTPAGAPVEDPRRWSSSYGFPPAEASAERAAEAALDELWQIHADLDAWLAQVTSGMSEAEAEAMLDSPAVRLDARAAAWIGPLLQPHLEARRTRGSWLA